MIGIAVLASGCNKNAETDWVQKNEAAVPTVKTVHFRAGELATRTVFGEKEGDNYPTLWTGNDACVKLALNYSEAGIAEVTPDEGFRTATFDAEIDAEGKQAPYTFYAVSPASAAKALSPSRQAWNVTIPSVQTPLTGSVDEAAQILAAASSASEAVPDVVDIHFNHLTAYGRLTLTNLALSGATVKAVELTATTPFVGDWYWNCEEGHSLTDNGASSTLTLKTDRTENLWFACAPVDMSGQIMVVTVYTDQGVLVKEIEFASGRKFISGHIAVFSVDMAGIELGGGASSDEFTLVTDESALQAGDELLILNAGETYAISTNQKSNNRDAAAISVSSHSVSEVPADVQVLTLEAGSNGTWYLSTGSGYLANANGNKNKLVTVSEITANATWTISVASSGVATVVAGAGERNIMRFNPNKGATPLFACYSSGQEDICIYRKGGAAVAGPVEEDPLTAEREYGCYLITTGRVYIPGLDQMARSYDASGVETFSIVSPASMEQLEISGYKKTLVKGDAVTLTVNWRIGLNKMVSGQTYKLRVVKEEGPKVWLGDGSGRGFIIKK